VSELDVRLFGGCAVATMLLNDEFTMDGREVAATYRSLCVFTRDGGRWVWAAGQTMRPQLS
jgi:ketosteroid isomerase-like protein